MTKRAASEKLHLPLYHCHAMDMTSALDKCSAWTGLYNKFSKQHPEPVLNLSKGVAFTDGPQAGAPTHPAQPGGWPCLWQPASLAQRTS